MSNTRLRRFVAVPLVLITGLAVLAARGGPAASAGVLAAHRVTAPASSLLSAPLPVGTSPVLVANASAGTVTDIGLDRADVTVKVGDGPDGVAMTPDGQYAYVANSGSGTVSVISGADTAAPKVKGTLSVGQYPIGVVVTPNGEYAYVVNDFSDTVSVISGAQTGAPTVTATLKVGQDPFGAAVTPDGNYVYVANNGGDTVSVISGAQTAHPVVTGSIAVGIGPAHIAVTPDGRYAYVSIGSGVTVIGGVETPAPAVLRTVALDRPFPNEVSITPDGQYVYVAEPCCGANSVSVISGAESTTPKLATTMTGFDMPSGVAFTPDGQHGYVTNFLAKTVSVISEPETASPKVTGTLPAGADPSAVAVDPQLAGIYTDFPSAGTVGTALSDSWPLLANPSAKSGSAKCQAPYTGKGSDLVMAQGLGRYETNFPGPVPWLSFWTVDAPPLKPEKIAPEQVGFAAGKYAASEIAAAALAVPGTPVTPTYVILDPEGETCGNKLPTTYPPCTKGSTPKQCQQQRNEYAIGYVWAHLSLTSFQELVAGWDKGVQTVKGLTPAVYLNKTEYNTQGGAQFIKGGGYPHVFVAVTPTSAKPHLIGTRANIVGYDAYYAPLAAGGACTDAAADISDVLSLGGSLNTVQFTNSKLCPP